MAGSNQPNIKIENGDTAASPDRSTNSTAAAHQQERQVALVAVNNEGEKVDDHPPPIINPPGLIRKGNPQQQLVQVAKLSYQEFSYKNFC